MRKKRVIYNTIATYILQVSQIIFSIVFPRWVMVYYGSSVNGLLSSITQFLSYIALMDAGVSAVVRSLLYKPLSDGDYGEVKCITKAAQKYYRKIAVIFLFYLISVSVLLPVALIREFDWTYTFSLTIIMGVSVFFEYFFGVTFTTLLDSDQKKYIYCLIHSISIAINLVLSIILIQSNCSIHLVKIITAIVFAIKPVLIYIYVQKKYFVGVSAARDKKIKDKWVGMANHIAYFLHTHIDIILLTLIKGTKTVSVYSVYNLIAMGIVSIIGASTGGIEALYGNMNALDEKIKLKKAFNMTEHYVFSISTILFSVAMVTIMPFISVYTRGITDVNYFNNNFALIFLSAEFFYCIRLPYQSIVVALGRIRETMHGAILEVVINLSISFTLVWKFGMIGVVCGTLCGMIYRTFDYSFYISKNYYKGDYLILFKRLFKATFDFFCIFLIHHFVPQLQVNNYFTWMILVIRTFFVSLGVVLLLNIIFFRKETNQFLNLFFRKKRLT